MTHNGDTRLCFILWVKTHSIYSACLQVRPHDICEHNCKALGCLPANGGQGKFHAGGEQALYSIISVTCKYYYCIKQVKAATDDLLYIQMENGGSAATCCSHTCCDRMYSSKVRTQVGEENPFSTSRYTTHTLTAT